MTIPKATRLSGYSKIVRKKRTGAARQSGQRWANEEEKKKRRNKKKIKSTHNREKSPLTK